MTCKLPTVSAPVPSLPSRGAWIEMTIGSALSSGLGGSLPSRGAWIEIAHGSPCSSRAWVAPLAGSVDRNYRKHQIRMMLVVAPLAGSVDRNPQGTADGWLYIGRSPRGERG